MSMDIFRDDVLAGKSILVTGGGSGLGKEIGKALAAKGAKVHICGRRANVLEEAVAEIGGITPPNAIEIRWMPADGGAQTLVASASATRSRGRQDRTRQRKETHDPEKDHGQHGRR